MTPDDLEAMVLGAQDPMELAHALAPLDEPQRAKLSSSAQKLFGQLEKNKASEGASDRLKAFIAGRGGNESWENWNSSQNRLAALALHGVGPLSAVKHRDAMIGTDMQRPVLDRIVRDRRPEWLDEWIAHELEQEWSRVDFGLLRGWIRDGVCAKPAIDGYYREFARYLMSTGFFDGKKKVSPISAQLLADPAMLDDIEGLFRVEHVGFNTNEWLTRGAAEDHETWPDALAKLAEQGHIERARLFELVLGGLRLGLKQNQLAGFHRLYKRLAPTAEEQLRHQGDYIALLCHPVGHVAKFALEMLANVEKARALDVGPFLREIEGLLTSGAKGNALAALKLLKRIAAQKGSDPAALAAIGAALRHGAAEVQAQALALLEAHAHKLGDAAALREAEGFAAASNRARLRALLERLGGEAAAPSATACRPTPADETTAYQPISEDINAQRILFAEGALTPITSVDELIDAAFHAVEVVESPDEVERIVDAIARLAGERPADFDARVAPLLFRLGENPTPHGLVGSLGVGSALRDLLQTWLTGELHRTHPEQIYVYARDDAFVPLIAHLWSLADRVAAKRAGHLLSAPTHKGGWIDPLVWVERLHAGDAETTDLCLSLLRLAPDHRAEALARTERLADPLRRLARFALGGDAAPAEADRELYAAWISAARCRGPQRDWSVELTPLRLADIWADGVDPVQYAWRSSQQEHQYRDTRWKAPELKITVEVNGAPAPMERPSKSSASDLIETDWQVLPSAALTRNLDSERYGAGDLNATWIAQWLAHLWPQNPAGACLKGVAKLHERIDEDSNGWEPRHGFMRVLFQRNRPWREAGHLLLCLGLAGKDADTKGLAVDALIEGIEGRLFDPERFAVVLGRLAEGEWVKFNRIADGLMLAIQVSDLHAAVVAQALEKILPRLDFRQKNAFRLLEVLVEAQAVSARPLSEEAREAVCRIDGSGKAAKLAKRILAN